MGDWFTSEFENRFKSTLARLLDPGDMRDANDLLALPALPAPGD